MIMVNLEESDVIVIIESLHAYTTELIEKSVVSDYDARMIAKAELTHVAKLLAKITALMPSGWPGSRTPRT